MFNSLRPFLSRVIAAAIAGLCTWLASHWAVDIDQDTRAQLVDAIVAFLIPVFTVIYAVLHRIFDKWINPADAAGSHLAALGVERARDLKAEDRRA